MFELDVAVFFPAAMAVGLLVVFLLWTYLESRADFSRKPAIRSFHCTKCGRLYAEHGSGKRPCPDCSFENISLHI